MDHVAAEPEKARPPADVKTPAAPAVHRLFALQRGAGNAAVTRSLQRDDAPAPAVAGDPSADAVPLTGDQAAKGKTTFPESAGAAIAVGGTFDAFANALAGTEAGHVQPGAATVTPIIAGDPPPAVTVSIPLVTSLPQWSPQTPSTDPAIAPKEQAEYKRFLGAIAAHEKGHRDLTKKNLATAHLAYGGVSSADGDVAYAKLQATDQTDNDAYDAANGHGVTGNPSTKINTNFGQTIKVP